MNKRQVVLGVSFLLPLVLSCECKKTASPTSAPTAATGQVIATLNGEAITDEDIRKVAGSDLAQAERELYDARKKGLDQIIEGRLLESEAKKRNISKEDFLKKEVEEKVKIEDRDLKKVYEEKKAQMQGKSFEEMKGNLNGYLHREKYGDLYDALIKRLKKNAQVAVNIKAPKVEVDEGDSPAIGPKDAPVHVVEWTDYQCPFCSRSRETVNQILDTYKGKVRYVIRDFPLSFHKDSLKAHEGAHCAGDQGKYWDMNKKLFGNQKDIKVEDLKKYAGEIKLNMGKFNECLDSGKYTKTVQENQAAGEKVGVSGTPAFFINGRMISGARPFSSFKEIIDDELANLD